MKPKEILTFINDIEEKFPVDKWIIAGVHVWPLFRLYIGEYLWGGNIQRIGNVTLLQKVIAFFKYFIGTIYQCIRLRVIDHGHNNELKSAEVLMVFYNMGRNIYDIEKKGWYDYIAEPIEDVLNNYGIQTYGIENITHMFELKRPRANKTTIICDSLLFKKLLFRIKNVKTIVSDNIDLPYYNEVVNYCEKRGYKGIIYPISYVNYLVQMLIFEAKIYEKIIQEKKISIAMVQDWRSSHEMALTLACSRQGIPCLEIQHGYYGQDFFTHYGWRLQPNGGYELKPNYYWCWTKGSADKMMEEISDGCAISGINPMKLYWNKKENIFANMIRTDIEKSFPLDRPLILFSLQNVLDERVFPEWIIDVVKETENQYFWLFRKHSSAERSGQDDICEKIEYLHNAEWKISTKLPLLKLLEYITVHVTMFSSVVVEAATEGVPSILLAKEATELFQEQACAGYAYYVDNKEMFLEKVNKLCSIKKEKLQGKCYQEKAVNELLAIVKKSIAKRDELKNV